MNKHSPTGQGALEYLLLVGGAVLIGSVVISLVFTVGGSGNEVVSHRSDDILNALEGGLGGGGGVPPPADCPDGDLDGAEECDPPAYLISTCTGLGFDGGTLGCTGSCTYDTSGCYHSTCNITFSGTPDVYDVAYTDFHSGAPASPPSAITCTAPGAWIFCINPPDGTCTFSCGDNTGVIGLEPLSNGTEEVDCTFDLDASDTEAPVILRGEIGGIGATPSDTPPQANLPEGTTGAQILVETTDASPDVECRYSLAGFAAWDSMTPFDTPGSGSPAIHTDDTLLAPGSLSDGDTGTIYVKCQDSLLITTPDIPLKYSVADTLTFNLLTNDDDSLGMFNFNINWVEHGTIGFGIYNGFISETYLCFKMDNIPQNSTINPVSRISFLTSGPNTLQNDTQVELLAEDGLWEAGNCFGYAHYGDEVALSGIPVTISQPWPSVQNWPVSGNTVYSEDISGLIQNRVNQASYTGGDYIAFRIPADTSQGQNGRGSAQQASTLIVNYNPPA